MARPFNKDSNKEERREKLKTYLDNYGYFNVPGKVMKKFAEDFGVSTRMIYKDKEFLESQIKFPQITEVAKRFVKAHYKNIRASHVLINNPDTKTKASGIALLNQSLQSFTKFLEEYGYKEKVADKLQLETTKQTNEQMMKFRDKLGEMSERERKAVFDALDLNE